MKKLILIILITVILLTACTTKPASKEPVNSSQRHSDLPPVSVYKPSPNPTQNSSGYQKGDNILMLYAYYYTNGTLIATNNCQLVANTTKKCRSPSPMNFTLGTKSTFPAVEKAIIGHNKGDSFNISLTPSQAFGKIDINKIISVKRTQPFKKIREVPHTYNVTNENFVKLFSKEPKIGTIVQRKQDPYYYTTSYVGDTYSLITALADVNQSFQFNNEPWNSTIISKDNYSLFVRQEPFNGSVTKTIYGTATVIIQDDSIILHHNPKQGKQVLIKGKVGRVIDITDDTFKIDFNKPLAGKSIIFNIRLV